MVIFWKLYGELRSVHRTTEIRSVGIKVESHIHSFKCMYMVHKKRNILRLVGVLFFCVVCGILLPTSVNMSSE